ncbi:hypothetical protein RclHR1_06270001 [Rhizophagus clarus]|uniref:Uncharacterized protein n=1 Tax=Rhizophagus clarus TaxID=94130 RepID=A0A2Z6RRI9_9GLOM|nr:hypothetical protein RclHR1_06270001 [Rhizophagus clarus]
MSSDPKTIYLCERLAQLLSLNHQILLIEFAFELENAVTAAIEEVPEELPVFQKMSTYLRILAIWCSFMYQVILRAAEYIYQSHLENYHEDEDFTYGTETDSSCSSTPAPQENFNISDTSEKSDSIIDSESSRMITEDIPKISSSSSKAHVDPPPSGKKSRKSQKNKIIKDK